MRKTLFGTSAIATTAIFGLGINTAVAAEGAAKGIELGISGYANNFFGAGSIDEADATDRNSSGLFSDGEIHFNGNTTLDNGIEVGVEVQLEAFSSGDQIDENYAWVEGSFGQVLLGSENVASYLLQQAAPYVGVPINSGWATVFVPAPTGSDVFFLNTGMSTYVDLGNDDNTVTYFTPRVGGFQVGASYVPAVTGATPVNFGGEGINFPTVPDQNTSYTNQISVGANFARSFGAFNVSISGGYQTAEAPDNPIGGRNAPDPEVWNAGINVGYAGFTLGGSYANETEGRRIFSAGRPVRSLEGESFDVGASYSVGPWSAGVTYLRGEVEGDVTNTDDDELEALTAGLSYALGPGVTTSLSALYVNHDEENLRADQDGLMGIAGLAVSF